MYLSTSLVSNGHWLFRFMDKMYSMSSPESLVKFVRSPRKYLVPPHPMLPCKVCVLGPPLSGKTTLANLIAEIYGATVSIASLGTRCNIHLLYCECVGY